MSSNLAATWVNPRVTGVGAGMSACCTAGDRYSLAWAMDSCIMRWGIISSAATSDIG